MLGPVTLEGSTWEVEVFVRIQAWEAFGGMSVSIYVDDVDADAGTEEPLWMHLNINIPPWDLNRKDMLRAVCGAIMDELHD